MRANTITIITQKGNNKCNNIRSKYLKDNWHAFAVGIDERMSPISMLMNEKKRVKSLKIIGQSKSGYVTVS